VEPCLLFGDRARLDAVAAALRRSGLQAKLAASEAEVVAMLGREPLAAAVIAHPVAASTLANIVAAATQRHPEIAIVVLGATNSVEEAVDAMRAGAADYLPPPIEPAVLRLRLERVLARRASGGAAATDTRRRKEPDFPGLVGHSSAMARLYETLAKVSRYKTNVLLLGESGTGKELIARALHARGPRRQKLFVPVNCATLGRELLENELFGHERGAFTGANERKKGLFELADGGTLFLDEIGEMDPSTQAKLLRVLERNEFRRVGGTDKVKVDLSLIAATHRNLPDSIASGKFREDLYYRLKVVTIVAPPLRERREDIPVLIESFIADFNARNSQQIRGISPALLKRFMEYDWPGNVRELKNAVESAAILASDRMLEVDPLEASARGRVPGEFIPIPASATLREAEQQIILGHLGRARTKMEAARSLGLGLRTLYTKLREYERRH
jgi:DNA-binding NtrC family response regulator